MAQGSRTMKCVVVGDSSIGKTCMLWSFQKNKFLQTNIPTVFDNFSQPMKVDGVSVNLGLWDTSGLEDYDRLRPVSYPQTDIFLICFSVVKSSSYSNVQTKWHPELAHYAPGVPYVLVGTQIDRREEDQSINIYKDVNNKLNSKGKRVYSKEHGERLASKIGAVRYMECSALTQRGLKMVFEEAVRIVLNPAPPNHGKKGKCQII